MHLNSKYDILNVGSALDEIPMSRKIDLVKKMHSYSLTAPSSEKGRWQTRFKDANGNIIRQDFLGTNVYNPLTKILEVGPAVAAEEPKTDIPLEETSSEIPNGENAEEVNPPQSGNQDDSQETVKPETPSQGEQNSDMEGGEQPEVPSDNGENIGESNNFSDEKTEEANVSSESTTDTE